MRIAVLGWGSLIWCPKNLKIKYVNWKTDGPNLPIEFARISKYKSLALVIYDEYLDDETKWVPVLWNEMDVESIEEAIGNLCKREKTTCKRIGVIYMGLSSHVNFKNKSVWCRNIKNFKEYLGPIPEGSYYYSDDRSKNYKEKIIETIESWRKKKELDGVVWTDLSSNFKVTEDSVIKYLEKIEDVCVREKAEEYIRNTPPQIQTSIRRELGKKFGWIYEGNSR